MGVIFPVNLHNFLHHAALLGGLQADLVSGFAICLVRLALTSRDADVRVPVLDERVFWTGCHALVAVREQASSRTVGGAYRVLAFDVVLVLPRLARFHAFSRVGRFEVPVALGTSCVTVGVLHFARACVHTFFNVVPAEVFLDALSVWRLLIRDYVDKVCRPRALGDTPLHIRVYVCHVHELVVFAVVGANRVAAVYSVESALARRRAYGAVLAQNVLVVWRTAIRVAIYDNSSRLVLCNVVVQTVIARVVSVASEIGLARHGLRVCLERVYLAGLLRLAGLVPGVIDLVVRGVALGYALIAVEERECRIIALVSDVAAETALVLITPVALVFLLD